MDCFRMIELQDLLGSWRLGACEHISRTSKAFKNISDLTRLGLCTQNRLDSSIRLKEAMKIYRVCMLGVGTFSSLFQTELTDQGFTIFESAVMLKRFSEAQVAPLPIWTLHTYLCIPIQRPVHARTRPRVNEVDAI